MSEYDARKAQLIEQTVATPPGTALGLHKDTSNLFRDRAQAVKHKLDVRHFCHVLEVDTKAGWVDVEGMTTYEKLVAATLEQEVMPAVVPQLKTITIGGAAAGVGIESSSFRYGLVHETLLEIEVLTGNGDVVVCRPNNEHADLFFGFPNSYGTLGYALRLKAGTVPVKPYVRLAHRRFESARAFFDEMALACAAPDSDFVDGVVFSPAEFYVVTGQFCDSAPYLSDYTFEHIYYRSIRERREDYLNISDYLWRWDADWFWCSKNLGAQNPIARRLLGRSRLNSRTYTGIMRWNSRWGITERIDRLLGQHRESVIQDVDIPIENAPRFLEFYLREIAILPAWVCPFTARQAGAGFPLYPTKPRTLYLNFGFWDVKRTREPHPPGHFNRLIEREVSKLGGIKSLYSDSYYSEEEFWRLFGKADYKALKARYDPRGVFPNLYDKCVLRG